MQNLKPNQFVAWL